MVPVCRHARHWRSYLAGGGLVLVLVTCGAVSPNHQIDGYTDTKKYEAAGNPAHPNAVPARHLQNSYDYSNPCKNADTQEQESLCVEWRSAKYAKDQVTWAGRSFGLGIIGTVFVVATLVANALATLYARRSADTANAALMADNRPWLNFEVGKIDGMLWDLNGLNISFPIAIKNFGPSPAVNVQVLLEFYSQCRVGDPRLSRLEQFWIENSQWREREFGFTTCIFPGSTDGMVMKTTAFRHAIEADQRAFFEAYGQVAEANYIGAMNLLVLVRYFMPGSKTVHHTRRAYSVGRKSSMVIDEDVPGPDVVLTRYPFSDYAG